MAKTAVGVTSLKREVTSLKREVTPIKKGRFQSP
jgi:hypothetical protein